MSTITCQSCGMQYDGSGLQAGVQFQCTQCGEMVKVGGAKRAAPGGKRPTGRPRAAGAGRPGAGSRRPGGPPAGRKPTRGPGRGLPNTAGGAMAGGAAGGAQEGPPQFGPPKKSNTGLFVGLGVGGVVIVLIIVAVVMGSNTSTPQQTTAQKQEEQYKQAQEQQRQRDEEIRKRNEAAKATLAAGMDFGKAIESSLRNSDASTLEGMFNWQLYAAYNKHLVDTVDNPKDYLNSPIIANGQWEKGDDDRYTGKFIGETVRGSDSLKTRVMGYIQDFYFGAQNITWLREKTETEPDGFVMELSGNKYRCLRIFIEYDGAGKTKEFWIGAPEGTTDMVIFNFVDGSAGRNLQGVEAKNPRRDDRDPRNDDRDPRNPDHDPVDGEDPPPDPDANLPEVAKTGKMPTDPALVNAIKELERDRSLNNRRLDNIRGVPNVNEKHATMGAIIDLMIDAQKLNDRNRKLITSEALWDVWKSFVPKEWDKDKMVYLIDFDGQAQTDLIVRRWIQVYNDYLDLVSGGG